MTQDSYPLSNYYEATALRHDYPTLRGNRVVDVCVIGGGVAGCSTALHLSQRGYRVALLEGARIGHGASGRSGGQLLPGYSCGQPILKSLLGAHIAHQMWNISVEAVSLAIGLIKQYQIDCDLKFGHLDVAIKQRHRDELLKLQDLLKTQYGYNTLRIMDNDELRFQLHSERYIAGLYDSATAHLHPLNYTLGLAHAAANTGASVYENAAVININRLSAGSRVVTSTGSVDTKYVVMCANVGNSALSGQSSRIMPVSTCMIATEALQPELLSRIMNTNCSVTDCNFIVDYFRICQSRLLFGGGVSYSGQARASNLKSVHSHMLQVFPQLKDVAIDHAWHGTLDISMNRAPDFGRIDNDLYYLQGFSGHGLALATIAGQLVAESIAMQSERFDLFSQIKHHSFPGGVLRTPLLMLAMLWYRLRDMT